MDEFDLIATYFAPLAGEGAFGLKDDIALSGDQIVSKDLLVEGVHFRRDDPIDTVAQKALRANLSDVIAKGCQPVGYFLGVVWPHDIGTPAIRSFARGLAQDQSVYGIKLMGGDTTRHNNRSAPLTISVTMLGRALGDGPVLRSGAKVGDQVFVTGTIGDSHLGLAALSAQDTGRHCDFEKNAAVIDAYRRPAIPFGAQTLIAEFASAAMDVSDGLIADGRHLAKASGVSLALNAGAIPLSEAGRSCVKAGGHAALVPLVTGGDDYQSLFTVAPDRVGSLMSAAAELGVSLTPIGQCADGSGVCLLSETGDAISVEQGGYSHF